MNQGQRVSGLMKGYLQPAVPWCLWMVAPSTEGKTTPMSTVSPLTLTDKRMYTEGVPLLEFMFLVFTRMPGESYHR